MVALALSLCFRLLMIFGQTVIEYLTLHVIDYSSAEMVNHCWYAIFGLMTPESIQGVYEMKRLSVLLVIVAVIMTGCIIVPEGGHRGYYDSYHGWGGHGYYRR